MAFDQATRKLLSKIVATCRDRLGEDIRDQLQSKYGMYPDGSKLDIARTERERQAASDLRDLLEHFIVVEAGTEKKRKGAAFQRLVREIGFTTLNRLAALRLCEERGIVIECIGKGMESDGFRLYDRMTGGALGNRYQTYQAFLEGLFDEIALDLGVLFDRDDPQSRFFPSESALNDMLAQLTDPELDKLGIWQQDETIGWIYQFYNDPKERKAMRDASQAPRNSRELAVRNQFFTPRYVVEFLTDNTLGRIWYEMRGGQTQLVEGCRYLVRTPEEQENEIPKRPKKDPRDLKILDPACGSGHFLLYAFDLLCTIYEEAWKDSDNPPFTETGTLLANDYSDLKSLSQEIPGLILRYNLFGVDIDPRTIQIAALALWLRSQRKYVSLELKPRDRPRITKTNLVVAEPMPGDQILLNEFVASLHPPLVGDLVRVVFEKMKLAGEAGTLLKIEEELAESISEAKKQWLARPKAEQLSLWSKDKRAKAMQLKLFDLRGISDEQFWETVEEKLLNALENYAEHTASGYKIQRKLFAEDAAQGFALVNISKQKFDVILMNPPFGESSENSLSNIRNNYIDSADNILCAFIKRGQLLTLENGLLGAITDRSYLVKKSYEEFRRNLTASQKPPQIIIDLGWNVLDANVEVCMFTLGGGFHECGFANIGKINDKERQIYSLCLGEAKIEWENLNAFLNMPNAAFVYLMPNSLRKSFHNKQHQVTVSSFYAARGLAGSNADHLYRLFWEVPIYSIGLDDKWVLIQKGSPFSPHYYGIDYVVYCDQGSFRQVLSYGSGRVTGIDDYGQPGLAYGKRTDYMYAFPMSKGQVFSVEGQAIFPLGNTNIWQVLAIINSSLFQELINHFSGQHKLHGYVNSAFIDFSALPDCSTLSKIIWNIIRNIDQTNETSFIFCLPRGLNLQEYNHISFSTGISNNVSDFQEAIKECSLLREEINQMLSEAMSSNNNVNYRGGPTLIDHVKILFGEEESPKLEASCIVSYIIGVLFGRWDIRMAIEPSLIPKLQNSFEEMPLCPPGMLLSLDDLPATSDKIVSEVWLQGRTDVITVPQITAQGMVTGKDGIEYPATIPDSSYPIAIQWDGILVDDPGLDEKTLHPSDIVLKVREVLKTLWPENHVEIESEVCEVLGVNDLREYFRKPNNFFANHLNHYTKSRRKAPIYWPLSTASGSYTLWIYYHRLDDEILYTAVNRYVESKIASVERHIAAQERELLNLTGKAASELKDKFDAAQAFLIELREFRDELLRIASLPYKPNLDDGVIINAAPFHKLFGLSKWAKFTKATWDKLEAGEYEWSQLAYTIWLERVREVCRKDKSIAIAHGLEELFQG